MIRCGSRAVHQISVMGTVVEVAVGAKLIHFQIDDGSAVLGCAWWRADIVDSNLDVSACVQMLQLGVVATVWGRISTYKGQRQLTVQHVAIEGDIHTEVVRWLRVIDLVENEYLASPLTQTKTPQDSSKPGASVLSSAVASSGSSCSSEFLRQLGFRFKEGPFKTEAVLKDESLLRLNPDPGELRKMLHGLFKEGLIFERVDGQMDFTLPTMARLILDLVRASGGEEVSGERLVHHAWKHECFQASLLPLRRQLAEQALESLLASGALYLAAGGTAGSGPSKYNLCA